MNDLDRITAKIAFECLSHDAITVQQIINNFAIEAEIHFHYHNVSEADSRQAIADAIELIRHKYLSVGNA